MSIFGSKPCECQVPKCRSHPYSVSFCTSSTKARYTRKSRRVFTLKVSKFLTGQVAKIPPFKDFDIPPPFPTGLDLKAEQGSYNINPICNEAMDVLDLYETGEWSAASSPCSELFDDIPSPASSLEDSCINDFSIDFTSYLDPAALNTDPDDLCKYLPPKSVKDEEPYLPEVDVGYFSKLSNVVVKREPKDVSPKLVMSCNNNNSKPLTVVPRDGHNKKLPSASSQLKAPSSRSTRKHSSNKRNLDKNTEEYRLKRERNNVAVRKSRYKTKQKFHETLHKVEELTEENDQLHSRVEVLTKELNVLRNLFSNPNIFKDQALARALLAQGLAEHSA